MLIQYTKLNIPIPPSELHEYEKQFKGPFNVTVWKLLHVQQWTCPDINYAISRLVVFLKAPTAMAFEALDHLVQYLYHHMHEPFFIC